MCSLILAEEPQKKAGQQYFDETQKENQKMESGSHPPNELKQQFNSFPDPHWPNVPLLGDRNVNERIVLQYIAKLQQDPHVVFGLCAACCPCSSSAPTSVLRWHYARLHSSTVLHLLG